MSTQTSFDLTGLSRAVRAGDCRYHLALYADDAQVEIVDDTRPDALRQVLRGKSAIGGWLDSVSSAAVDQQLKEAVAHPDRVVYTEECRFADGSKLFYECSAQIRRGQISRAAVHVSRDGSQPADPDPVARSGPPARRVLPPPRHPDPRRNQNLPGNFLG